MSVEPDDDLRHLVAEEPFVRALAHQLIVDEADEVVQQTYLQAARHGGRGVAQPRNWLARIARNVAANLRRTSRNRQRLESLANTERLVPSSAELAEREECRRALVAAVDALPKSLRTVVLLRWFDGQPPRRIAKALGVPAATVSTQLRRAHELLRDKLDASHGGDRRAWLLPLVPFATRPELPPAPLLPAIPAITGALAMTTKSKIAVAAAMAVAAGTLIYWPTDEPHAPTPATAPTQPSASIEQADLATGERAATPAATTTDRVAATPAAAASRTGNLVVHVHYDDGQSAPDRVVTVRPRSGDPRYDGWRRRTDAAGTVRFDGLEPGKPFVACGDHRGKGAVIKAGETTEIDLELAGGVTLRGLVVDEAGRPVSGAIIEAAPMATVDVFPDVVAVSDDRGRFSVRAITRLVLVGARADGYTASAVKFLHGKDGNDAEVRLVLGAGGCIVDGRVVDDDGEPVPDATVIIGAGELSGIGGRDHLPPFPSLARSDRQGRFRASGIPAGEHPVKARATGFAPSTTTTTLVAGAPTELTIPLQPGAVVHGTVVDPAGQPVARARVEFGGWDDLAHNRTRTGADGSYRLSGLPIGELTMKARHDDHGKAATTVHTSAGQPSTCDLQLSRGLVWRGTLVDPDGNPLSSGVLELMAETPDSNGSRWYTFARADKKGRFEAANCPTEGTLLVTVQASGYEQRRLNGVDPKRGEIEIALERVAASTVHIRGTVVGPDGQPVANASVDIRRKGGNGNHGLQVTDNDGRFDVGPLPPGAWTVAVRSPQHPAFRSDEHVLAAHDTWDLGTITLRRGGRAVLATSGASIDGVRFLARGDHYSQTSTFGDEGGRLQSRWLLPGDYHVRVTGKDVAAQWVPFTILADEETTVAIVLQQGVRQVCECRLPTGADVGSIYVDVHRDGKQVARRYASTRAGKQPTAETWLAPGLYTFRVEAGELAGSATVTVGTTPGAPVVIELR